MQTFTRPERITLKNHILYNEKWVQDRIAEDPKILGLGDLALRDKERIQPQAGRLDLLLEDTDPEAVTRYEVEIQLGSTDESHIIRTLEYWDIERRRYPQYDHCAVIVAEDITSRFLNVVSLFNGFIPLIAIQMQAFKIKEYDTLLFTTVMDKRTLGVEPPAPPPAVNRAYWEEKTCHATIEIVDQLLKILQEFDPSLVLNYNKYYIGLSKGGRVDNFVSFRPRKNSVVLDMASEPLQAPRSATDTARARQSRLRGGAPRRRISCGPLRIGAASAAVPAADLISGPRTPHSRGTRSASAPSGSPARLGSSVRQIRQMT